MAVCPHLIHDLNNIFQYNIWTNNSQSI